MLGVARNVIAVNGESTRKVLKALGVHVIRYTSILRRQRNTRDLARETDVKIRGIYGRESEEVRYG